MKSEIKQRLRKLRDGEIHPESKEGRDIMKLALLDDLSLTIRSLSGSVPKNMMVKSMKFAGFNSAEIGHVLFTDLSARQAFFEQERLRTDRMNMPGYDRHGDPINRMVTDPFAAPLPRISKSSVKREIDEFDDPLAPSEDEQEFAPGFQGELDKMLRGPRPA